MQFCCQVPSSSKLYRWCTVYMSATAPECDIFNLWFIIFDCRMTNYELLHWLVETPSRDVEHYRMSTASRSTVRQFNVWRQTLNCYISSAPQPSPLRTRHADRLDPGNSGSVRNVRCRWTRTVTIRYQRWWPWGRLRADRVLTTWSSCVWRRRGAQRNVVSEIARRFVHLLWCPKDDSFVWFLLAVDRVSGSTLTVVGRSRLLARRPGTHSRILSGMQRAAQTFFIYESLFTENFRRLLKTYLFARYYCIQRIRVLNDYALYKSTHSLTHSLMATYEGHRPKAGRCV